MQVQFESKIKIFDQNQVYGSDAASGWAGWALAHLEFGSSVNPITTMGTDYAHRITASPPGFENLAASLMDKHIIIKLFSKVSILSLLTLLNLARHFSKTLLIDYPALATMAHSEYTAAVCLGIY